MIKKEAVSTGALVGWKRQPTENGIAFTLQFAESSHDFETRNFETIHLILNDRQLRSFARDLNRAADDRGIELWAVRKRKWKFW